MVLRPRRPPNDHGALRGFPNDRHVLRGLAEVRGLPDIVQGVAAELGQFSTNNECSNVRT